jgi:hypothetical protein
VTSQLTFKLLPGEHFIYKTAIKKDLIFVKLGLKNTKILFQSETNYHSYYKPYILANEILLIKIKVYIVILSTKVNKMLFLKNLYTNNYYLSTFGFTLAWQSLL